MKSKPITKSTKRRRTRKKKKIPYSFNSAAVALNAKLTAGWKSVNVVGEGSAHRIEGSMISR